MNGIWQILLMDQLDFFLMTKSKSYEIFKIFRITEQNIDNGHTLRKNAS